jgi:hypothetical protein
MPIVVISTILTVVISTMATIVMAGIPRINIINVTAIAPGDRTVKVVCADEQIPLSVVEENPESGAACPPSGSIKVISVVDTQEIVEVDAVCPVIFTGRESHLISHFIRQVPGFNSRSFIAHCLC